MQYDAVMTEETYQYIKGVQEKICFKTVLYSHCFVFRNDFKEIIDHKLVSTNKIKQFHIIRSQFLRGDS